MKNDEIKAHVKEGYARIASQQVSTLSPLKSCCCGGASETISIKLGYSEEELHAVPEGANLGLGCGNPIALASLKEGETVLDLGSGAGFDCFLAAQRAGPHGRVIGVDMTPEMLAKARQNAERGGYQNVEFRQGELENLPVENSSVDIIISNCVINLSPDKRTVFKEAFRVLKPGGRIMVSDIVKERELPPNIQNTIEAYIGCIAGAVRKEEYLSMIREAGFQEVRIVDAKIFPLDLMANDPTAQQIINDESITPEDIEEASRSTVSVKVSAIKPLSK